MSKNSYIKNKISENEKKKKQKNKRISAIILLVFFSFCAIGSSFGIASFFGCQGVKEVSADSVNLIYDFKGSNIYHRTLGINPHAKFDPVGSTTYLSNFRFSLRGYNDVEENSYKTEIVFTTGYVQGDDDPYIIFGGPDPSPPVLERLPKDGSWTITQEKPTNDSFYDERFYNADFFCQQDTYDGPNDYNPSDAPFKCYFHMTVAYSNQSYFDANVVKVEFGHIKFNDRMDYEDYFYFTDTSEEVCLSWYNYKINYMRYYDNDGDYIEFQFPLYCGQKFDAQYLYDYRVYYLEPTDGVSSSDAYLQGVNKGYEQGKKDGLNEGYNKGYNYGKQDWYWAGYHEGLANNSDYTFVGLLGAAIDAPIIALFGDTVIDANGKTVRENGLLNFELLGMNLSAFLGGLLMASLVIAVIKLVL